MGKMSRGDKILQLLLTRNERMDAERRKRIREARKAKLWAKEIYNRLLQALCQEDSFDIHDNRFLLIGRLNGDAPDSYERLQLNELGGLLNINPERFQAAVEIKQEQAAAKCWHAAHLNLDVLKGLLQEA
ncbi:hypothetical protein KBD34_03050 [Patescibacteria group bacterium]|nr:hypothetical protein [Patescibacteria group bacterium]